MVSHSFFDSIQRFSHQQVLVLGDVMLDEYHWCQVSRISPEAPVPVCRVDKTTLVPGGAANVAHNLQSMGCPVLLLGVIGQDSAGDKLRCALLEYELSVRGLIQDGRKPTTLKSRIVAHQQHVVRVDRESSAPISEDLEIVLLEQFDCILPQCGAVILSDYLKGTLTPRVIRHVVSACKAASIPVVVDPKGSDYSRYTGATVLTPNFGEFLAAVRHPALDEASILTYGVAMIRDLSLSSLVVTRSEHGVSVIELPHQKSDIPAKALEVFDITGAGDTFIAVLAMGLSSQMSIRDAAYLANLAAGIVVGKVGTSTLTRDELIEAVNRDLNAS